MSGRWVNNSDGRPGVDPWCCDPVERAALDVHAFRRASHQRRESVDVLRKRLPKRRNGRALIGQHAFLLRHVEIGSGAGTQPLFDRIQDTLSAGDVALGDANPVLCGKDLKIGIRDAGERRQRDHIAIKAARGRRLLRGQRGIAVFAPEIDFDSWRRLARTE